MEKFEKLVGYQMKSGSFTDTKTGNTIDYDNVILYCITNNDSKVVGCSTYEIKIKTKEIKDILGIDSVSELNNWIDKVIKSDYGIINGRPVLLRIKLVK